MSTNLHADWTVSIRPTMTNCLPGPRNWGLSACNQCTFKSRSARLHHGEISSCAGRAAGVPPRAHVLCCVEAWSIVAPWAGYPLSTLLKQVEPTPKARFVALESLLRPEANARLIPEQLLCIGARGGRAYGRNQRARRHTAEQFAAPADVLGADIDVHHARIGPHHGNRLCPGVRERHPAGVEEGRWPEQQSGCAAVHQSQRGPAAESLETLAIHRRPPRPAEPVCSTVPGQQPRVRSPMTVHWFSLAG